MLSLPDLRLEELLARAEDLPSLPTVALEVLSLCRADDTTIDDLARALSADPALAARLLRFANSSMYSPGEEVRTLQRATLVLGLKTVQLMSLSFSLVSALPREGTLGAFDYGHYWRRSLVRAVSARTLAGRVGLPAQDEAFLAGLLAEIGQVVLARGLASPYALVLRAAAAQGVWPGSALEREHLGFDHHDVGGGLLSAWQLPRVLELAVRHAGRPDELAPETPGEITQLVRVLALAAQVAELFTQGAGAESLARAREQAQRWFGLGTAQLDELLSALEAPIQETSALLELAPQPGRSHAQILAEACAELLRRSLGQARELTSLRMAVDPALRAALLADPAHVDELTGTANASAFQRLLEHEIGARRDGNLTRPLGLLRLEIDHFTTSTNEEQRRETQRALCGHLVPLMRQNDLVARLGAGSFVVLLGDATPYGLRILVERLRRAAPSVCVGGACLGRVRKSTDGSALLEVVERLLAKAQARGAGQSEIHATLLQAQREDHAA